MDPLRKRERSVTVRVPTRIDLAGGTVDIWPLYLFHPRAVTINVAIDRWVWVRTGPFSGGGICLMEGRQRETRVWESLEAMRGGRRVELFRTALAHFGLESGVSIEAITDAPAGAGLAGSSSLLVALCAALARFKGQRLSGERFIALVRDLETRLIRVPAGLQDYYPAIRGGVQALWWGAGGVEREEIGVSGYELERRLLLVYTGVSRHSGRNNWEVFKRHIDGHRGTRQIMGEIVEASREMFGSLRDGDFHSAGLAMAREAKARGRLSPGIAGAEIRKLQSVVARKGATALKVCGAGGGGCAVVFADPERKELLARRIRQSGFEVLPFRIVERGLTFDSRRWPAAAQAGVRR